MSAQARSLVAWLIVGLICGWVASLLRSASAGGIVEWLIAGVIGAAVGGFLAQQLRIDLKTGNRFLEQVIFAVIGSVVVIIIAGLIL